MYTHNSGGCSPKAPQSWAKNLSLVRNMEPPPSPATNIYGFFTLGTINSTHHCLLEPPASGPGPVCCRLPPSLSRWDTHPLWLQPLERKVQCEQPGRTGPRTLLWSQQAWYILTEILEHFWTSKFIFPTNLFLRIRTETPKAVPTPPETISADFRV
jgi:hypothetical protein